MAQVRIKRHPVDGVLLLDKPRGISANGALRRVQYLLRAQKAGHGGTLDPLASGLLPLCFGQASKFSKYWLQADKTYQVRAQLGVTTDTLDSEGQVLERRAVTSLQALEVQQLLANEFSGPLRQLPPLYSALKHQGRPLYELARQGIADEAMLEAKWRSIEVYRAQLLAKGDDWLDIEFSVSKGTYIRSLVRDLGEMLGCGAHITSLRRLSHGPFAIQQSVEMPGPELDLDSGVLKASLLPVNFGLQLAKLNLDLTQAQYLMQGRLLPELQGDALVQCFYQQQFLGVAKLTAQGLKPDRLLQPETVCLS